MNKFKTKNKFAAILAAVSIVGLTTIPAFAEEKKQGNTTASVPVYVSGTTSSSVVIEQEINGLYKVIDVKQISQSSVVELTEEDVGKYTYRIYQTTETDSNIVWDKTVYQIDVYVLIDEITQRYSTETVIYKIGSGQKSAAVSFVNQIKPAPTSTPTTTPTMTPTATPGATGGPADSDDTADVSSTRDWVMFGLCVGLTAVFLWAYKKDEKERVK